tara:strand:- start:47069 stop:47545 length:477 start_codon:yes stop_codon:yes gene_type:complete
MSLGKHLEGYTVNEKGRTLKDLLIEFDIVRQRWIKSQSNIELRNILKERWDDTIALIITILTNHDIPCNKTKKESDKVIYFMNFRQNFDEPYLCTYITFSVKYGPFCHYYNCVSMTGGVSDIFKHGLDPNYDHDKSLDILLEHLPGELKRGLYLSKDH